MSKKKKVGRKSDYKAYIKYYNELKQKMNKQGFHMYEKKLTKREWENYHTAMKNDRLDEIAEGKRKIVGNINRDLAKMQQWEFSSKQAHAMQESLKMRGMTANIKEIRAGQAFSWDDINARRQQLINAGFGYHAYTNQIAEEFFGS